MNPKILLIVNLFLSFMALIGGLQAQQADAPLTAKEKAEVVDSISAILQRNYVFPDVAKQIVAHLEKQEKSGLYNSIDQPMKFADILSEDVRAINGDKHLRVMFDPERIRAQKSAITEEDSLALVNEQKMRGMKNNFGFQKVEFLEGNIGYLNLTGFYDTEFAAETAIAAMNYLSNSDALIIDLRQNGGGSPKMIQLITSYLYGQDPVHLNNFYWRPSDEHTQTWTLPYVPGKRRPDVPVYVLTSQYTFSAAEEFSYNLRNLKRATLVGETTGGGAHPGGTEIATDRFAIWVPSGKAINPISNDNWEGVGVKPHIETKAADALNTAHLEAIKNLMEKASADEKDQFQWALDGLKAKTTTVQLEDKLLKSYAGAYGPRHLIYEDGALYYQRTGRPKFKLTPMTKTMFSMEEIPYFRIKMILEKDSVVGLEGHYSDGRVDLNKKDITP
jgi:hypothetical protein